MEHPMSLSLGEAAKLAGVHKTTIARKVSEGVIAGKKLDDGSYKIDRSSLAWVYPAVMHLDTAEKVETYLHRMHSAFEIIGARLVEIEERLRQVEGKG